MLLIFNMSENISTQQG